MSENKPQRPGVKFDMELGAVEPKAAIEALMARRATGFYIMPVGSITVAEGFNIRMAESPSNRAAVDQIKRSIISSGFMQDKPLGAFLRSVEGVDQLTLWKGHRRFQAVQELIAEGQPITGVPVYITNAAPTIEELTKQLHSENSDQRPTMIESAIVSTRLQSYGRSVVETAAEMGVTTSQIENFTILLSCPRYVRDCVIKEKISGSQVVEMYRKFGAKDVETMVRESMAVAEAAGKTRVTNKHVKAVEEGQPLDDTQPRIRMVPVKETKELVAGQRAPLKDWKLLLALFSDKSWYKKEGEEIEALEDVKIEVKITRPVVETEEELAKRLEAKAKKDEAAKKRAEREAALRAKAKAKIKTDTKEPKEPKVKPVKGIEAAKAHLAGSDDIVVEETVGEAKEVMDI